MDEVEWTEWERAAEAAAKAEEEEEELAAAQQRAETVHEIQQQVDQKMAQLAR